MKISRFTVIFSPGRDAKPVWFPPISLFATEPPKAFLTLVELAIANMYEVEAIGELLEQKGVMTKDEIIAFATELKKKAPPVKSATAFRTSQSQQPFTAQENAVLEELMAVILQHGLSAEHAQALLSRTIQLVGMGETVCTRDASGERLAVPFQSPIPFIQPFLYGE